MKQGSLLPFYTNGIIEAGTDEAGRGCLAGPVVAAAVILPRNGVIKGLDDSKKLTEKQRLYLREIIVEKALSYGFALADNREIDEINILNASFLAMHRALAQLKPIPEQILVDGNRFKPYGKIPHVCIVKGDGKYSSIAAASVLAKTYRDEFMEKMHEIYPNFGWKSNKGYPTIQHRMALKIHGFTPFHRRSFHLKDEQLSLEL
jgi:ribonuclease HII